MIALLGILMAVTVSGCEQVEGILGGEALLPCSCSGRDTTQLVEWQMFEQFFIFRNVNNVSTLNTSYTGRVKVLLESNCSLLLTSIKKEDQGKYKCFCHIEEIYKDFCVNLSVAADFTVCQSESPQVKNEKVFHCNVSGRDKDAKIQWYSDGQQLTNSSETTITQTSTLGTESDLNRFSSNLRTHLNISNPKCDVKSVNIQTRITETCNGGYYPRVQPIQERHRYLSIILIVMAAGLCMVLVLCGCENSHSEFEAS